MRSKQERLLNDNQVHIFYSALEAELILECCQTFVYKIRRQQQREVTANIRKAKVRKHNSMLRPFKFGGKKPCVF